MLSTKPQLLQTLSIVCSLSTKQQLHHCAIRFHKADSPSQRSLSSPRLSNVKQTTKIPCDVSQVFCTIAWSRACAYKLMQHSRIFSIKQVRSSRRTTSP